ncbi:hypothetical protein SDC9_168131 [bioreactor metagenome]|uniref:Uncharacterized protein n=1 Tax=bioreactor metagenome TaxID=1076179 RepID=A0A645G478_9ZZZZ
MGENFKPSGLGVFLGHQHQRPGAVGAGAGVSGGGDASLVERLEDREGLHGRVIADALVGVYHRRALAALYGYGYDFVLEHARLNRVGGSAVRLHAKGVARLPGDALLGRFEVDVEGRAGEVFAHVHSHGIAHFVEFAGELFAHHAPLSFRMLWCHGDTVSVRGVLFKRESEKSEKSPPPGVSPPSPPGLRGKPVSVTFPSFKLMKGTEK